MCYSHHAPSPNPPPPPPSSLLPSTYLYIVCRLNWPGNRHGRRTVDELGRTRSMIARQQPNMTPGYARQYDDEQSVLQQQQRRRRQTEGGGEGKNDARPAAPGVTRPSSPYLQALAPPSTPTSPKPLRVRESERESLTRPSSPERLAGEAMDRIDGGQDNTILGHAGAPSALMDRERSTSGPLRSALGGSE